MGQIHYKWQCSMAMLVYQRVIPIIWVPHLGLQDRDRVVYLLRWLCTTCEVPFEGAPGEPEDSEGNLEADVHTVEPQMRGFSIAFKGERMFHHSSRKQLFVGCCFT